MIPWVITGIDIIPEIDALLVYAYTNVQDHLFMCWNYTRPARQRIIRNIRGVDKFCGWRWYWHEPYIAEQIEPGDTLDHLLYLIHLTPGAGIYFMLWAPDGPYGEDIQGPLMHVTLLPFKPPWTHEMYLATRAKGVYHTLNFHDTDPTWIPDNGDIPAAHLASTFQSSADPVHPRRRRFIIAGGHLWRLDTLTWEGPATSTLVLTNAQACTLTGSASGILCFVEGNVNRPGNFYVLFNSALTTNGTWCIRTLDYGETWTARQIYNGAFNYDAGNISAGIEQGASPWDAGLILYASLNSGAAGNFRVYTSWNNGYSWAFAGEAGYSLTTPRCLVDPTDQSAVYIGAYTGFDTPRELFRSETHGSHLTEVDGVLHLGIFFGTTRGVLWIDPTDNFHAKVLQAQRVWKTEDHCATWIMGPLTEIPVQRMAILKYHPANLYLARAISAPEPPDPEGPHVIFASNDDGLTMHGKAGAHADQEDGAGDSVPWNCGGVSRTGIMPIP